MIKQCTKCKEVKPLSEFYKHKETKDGHSSWCKRCKKEFSKIPIKSKFCEVCNNKFKPTGNCQKYCSKKCREIVEKEYRKISRKKPKNKEWAKKYYEDNIKHIKEYKQEWLNKNPDYFNEYQKQRRKVDLNFKITGNLRHRVNMALKNNSKSKKTAELLNCTIDFYIQFLAEQFTPKMSWDNWGTYWEIDHIIPCCSFDFSKPEEQFKCFNYKNTRPLTITKNRKKGGTK